MGEELLDGVDGMLADGGMLAEGGLLTEDLLMGEEEEDDDEEEVLGEEEGGEDRGMSGGNFDSRRCVLLALSFTRFPSHHSRSLIDHFCAFFTHLNFTQICVFFLLFSFSFSSLFLPIGTAANEPHPPPAPAHAPTPTPTPTPTAMTTTTTTIAKTANPTTPAGSSAAPASPTRPPIFFPDGSQRATRRATTATRTRRHPR